SSGTSADQLVPSIVASTPLTVSDSSESSDATSTWPVMVSVGDEVYTPRWSTVSELHATSTTASATTPPRRSLALSPTFPPCPPARHVPPAPSLPATRHAAPGRASGGRKLTVAARADKHPGRTGR